MEKDLYTNLMAVTWRNRKRLSVAFLTVLASNGLLVFLPLLFRQAVLSVNPATADMGEGIPLHIAHALGSWAHSVWIWVALLVLVAISSAYFMYRMRVEFVAVSRDVERRVRSRLFDRLQAQSRAFYDHHHVGDLMSILTNDMAAYREVLGPGIMYPLYFATMVIPAMIALYSISPPMATVSLLPILILPLFILVTQRRVYQTSKEVQEVLGEMSTFAQEHFSAVRLIKGAANEKLTLRLFDQLGDHYFQLNIWLAALRGLFFPFLTLFTKCITLALVLFAGYSLFYGWSQITSADFVSFMWIQSNVFGPVLFLGWVLPIYQRGSAAYSRLVTMYNEPVEVDEGPKHGPEVRAQADITIRDLSFTYPKASAPSLKNIDLTIKGGTFVGITGPVAAGKTSLFRLINREYEIPKGKISIGEHDIHDYNVEALRRHIGVVEQAPFLFSKTVAENVGIGLDRPSMEEIEQVARMADLHESVLTFPAQYETVVGERGVRLSGGQRQRVAIARTFLVNRSIVLLDDIFSAVDAGTERRIFAHMRENFSGSTVLLITHRTTLLQQMDRVLYMAGGSIVEDGSHVDLMAQKGRYAALVELQSLGGLP
ncbi:MAG: ABC transporter ATP-binding protein [Chlamydiales bacterium]|nr:ABC transporter ATP-binding protein [Chlamydiales bacterium]